MTNPITADILAKARDVVLFNNRYSNYNEGALRSGINSALAEMTPQQRASVYDRLQNTTLSEDIKGTLKSAQSLNQEMQDLSGTSAKANKIEHSVAIVGKMQAERHKMAETLGQMPPKYLQATAQIMSEMVAGSPHEAAAGFPLTKDQHAEFSQSLRSLTGNPSFAKAMMPDEQSRDTQKVKFDILLGPKASESLNEPQQQQPVTLPERGR